METNLNEHVLLATQPQIPLQVPGSKDCAIPARHVDMHALAGPRLGFGTHAVWSCLQALPSRPAAHLSAPEPERFLPIVQGKRVRQVGGKRGPWVSSLFPSLRQSRQQLLGCRCGASLSMQLILQQHEMRKMRSGSPVKAPLQTESNPRINVDMVLRA